MERPLEIAFHNTQPSESAEADIRRHVDKLAERFSRLIGCRVTVKGLHHQHRTEFEVHIVMAIPGRDLVISHEPHHAKDRRAHPDVYSAIKDAFKAAERQLAAHKHVPGQDMTAPSGSALAGRVSLLEPGADHGYIDNAQGTQLYFHRDSLTLGAFETLKEGDPVHYVETEGETGPVAFKVRIAAGN